jgi:hypothetical protein
MFAVRQHDHGGLGHSERDRRIELWRLLQRHNLASERLDLLLLVGRAGFGLAAGRSIDDVLHADRFDQLEWSQLPSESPSHDTVHIVW